MSNDPLRLGLFNPTPLDPALSFDTRLSTVETVPPIVPEGELGVPGLDGSGYERGGEGHFNLGTDAHNPLGSAFRLGAGMRTQPRLDLGLQVQVNGDGSPTGTSNLGLGSFTAPLSVGLDSGQSNLLASDPLLLGTPSLDLGLGSDLTFGSLSGAPSIDLGLGPGSLTGLGGLSFSTSPTLQTSDYLLGSSSLGLGLGGYGLGLGTPRLTFGSGYESGLFNDYGRYGLGSSTLSFGSSCYGLGYDNYSFGLGYGLGYDPLGFNLGSSSRYGFGYDNYSFGLGYGLGYSGYGLGYGLGYSGYGLGYSGYGLGYSYGDSYGLSASATVEELETTVAFEVATAARQQEVQVQSARGTSQQLIEHLTTEQRRDALRLVHYELHHETREERKVVLRQIQRQLERSSINASVSAGEGEHVDARTIGLGN